jgi:hypothetical protein
MPDQSSMQQAAPHPRAVPAVAPAPPSILPPRPLPPFPCLRAQGSEQALAAAAEVVMASAGKGSASAKVAFRLLAANYAAQGRADDAEVLRLMYKL